MNQEIRIDLNLDTKADRCYVDEIEYRVGAVECKTGSIGDTLSDLQANTSYLHEMTKPQSILDNFTAEFQTLAEYRKIGANPYNLKKRMEDLENTVVSLKQERDVLNSSLTALTEEFKNYKKQKELECVGHLDYNDDLLRIAAKVLTGYEASLKRHCAEHNDSYDPYRLTEQDALSSKIVNRFLALCREEIGKR